MTPLFRTQTSFIALLNIIIIIIIIVSNHDAAASAAFVGSSSCSFVSKRNKPSIHHQDHIMTMMGKRYQGSKSNNKKKQSIESLLELETDLHDRGYKYVIGSDVSQLILFALCYLQLKILTKHLFFFVPGFRRSRLYSWTGCRGKLLRFAPIFFSLQ